MDIKKIAAVTLAVAASLAMADDNYQYIVSGDPVANPCSSLASDGMPLMTGCYAGQSGESPLEARYRTWNESNGIGLRSDKFRGITIYIR